MGKMNRCPESGQNLMFTLLWPEKKVVSEDTIVGWYQDAIANHEFDAQGYEIGTEWQHLTPQEMATALHEAGLITLEE